MTDIITILCIIVCGLTFELVYTQWDPKRARPQWEPGSWDKYPGNKDKPHCPPDSQWSCWEPPFYPYDEIHRTVPDIGEVVGRSMAYAQYRYINWFLGVPYAKAPIYQRRFEPPEDCGPEWDQGIRYWDASYYRDACPQEIWRIQHKYYEQRNTSEDCLHINMFSPNLTDRPHDRNRDYPIFVFIHGEDFKLGDAMLNPGHLVAKKEVFVVTFNYRLGALVCGYDYLTCPRGTREIGYQKVLYGDALHFERGWFIFSEKKRLLPLHCSFSKLVHCIMGPQVALALAKAVQIMGTFKFVKIRNQSGFMSTMDPNSPGNYGLYDVLKVLEWIQNYGQEFGGDPDKVTIVGHGSGAAMASLLLLSPKSKLNGYKPLFHQVILMSGSDYCEWAEIGELWTATPLEYTKELGRQVGCDPDYGLPIDRLVLCLRQKHYEEIVNASASVFKMHGSLAGPFGPVVDGDLGVLPDTPENLRKQGDFMKVKILTGVTKDAGSYLADNITKDMVGVDMTEGLEPSAFREILYKLTRQRAPVRNVHEVVGTMEYEYTFWAKPDNKTAVRQNLIDLWSDMMYGWCMDAVLKSHVVYDEAVYMYVFDHRSLFEPLPLWMGVPYGRDVDYLFAHPFFNDTLGNITGIIPDQWEWTYLDRNISEFVQDMWVNFTKYGIPTTEWTRNVTWYPYTRYNLSYLYITEWARMDINFRQNHYAFWREYMPVVATRQRITTTPQPTPRPRIEYEIATWCLVGAALITVFVLAALGITLYRRSMA